jgi:ABC-type antimicrobial peptide transport system permease subunit
VAIEPPGQRVAAERLHIVRKADDDNAIVVSVVGVTTDVVSGFVYEGRDAAHLYLPTSAAGSRADALMLRLRPGHRGIAVDAVQSILQRAHPDPLAFDVLAVNEMLALQMFPLRAASWLGSMLSAVALALSISGLYGVLTYIFGRRAQEIGIRMALGASASAVVRLVLVQAGWLAGLGAAVGAILSFTLMKMLGAVVRLENVTLLDLRAFALSLALIGVAVALASCAPARRAARVDPASLLRADA